jgi:hypothetical protein
VALRPRQGAGIRVAPKTPALIAATGRTPIRNGHVTRHRNPERMVATFKNRPVRNLGTVTTRNAMDQEIPRIVNARSAKQLPRVSLCLSACARSSGPSIYIYINCYNCSNVVLYRIQSVAYEYHRKARGILRSLGTFMDIESTFLDGNRLAARQGQDNRHAAASGDTASEASSE